MEWHRKYYVWSMSVSWLTQFDCFVCCFIGNFRLWSLNLYAVRLCEIRKNGVICERIHYCKQPVCVSKINPSYTLELWNYLHNKRWKYLAITATTTSQTSRNLCCHLRIASSLFENSCEVKRAYSVLCVNTGEK